MYLLIEWIDWLLIEWIVYILFSCIAMQSWRCKRLDIYISNIVYMLSNKEQKQKEIIWFSTFTPTSSFCWFHCCLVCSDAFLGTILLLVGSCLTDWLLPLFLVFADLCMLVSPPCVSEADRYSLEALRNIHQMMDDDHDGGIEVEESVEVKSQSQRCILVGKKLVLLLKCLLGISWTTERGLKISPHH